ncbi:MAG: selenium-dependent molybdenum cofactor biosynthesis protein YqeB [Defluviitaleaceae bacterium]|nr:selenium-dependent molybdenum cofactor biosynthesis protein YqeB [Defluviitaleaceae bacterium]
MLIAGSRTVVVRGGGDIATGVVQKLQHTGFHPVVLESAAPTAIRRSVALSQAVYDGAVTVEDIRARLITEVSELPGCFAQGVVPVLVDEYADSVSKIGPVALVDAIIAKRNLGTHRGMAPVTIGLGPGFTAGEDVDIAVETMRGHNLGRLLYSGAPTPNTGVPGEVGGVASLRVIHSPAGGRLCAIRGIGEAVDFGATLAYVGSVPVIAPISGLLRGMIRDGLFVRKGQKIADIDPRAAERDNWRTISDKSRAVGGAVLEALLREIHTRRTSHEH